jgi:hypothetical protein
LVRSDQYSILNVQLVPANDRLRAITKLLVAWNNGDLNLAWMIWLVVAAWRMQDLEPRSPGQ